MEKRLLQTTPSVETRREVVGAERAAQRCAGTLQHDSYDQEYRKPYLHVWQSRLEKNHPLENSTGGLENQRSGTISQYRTLVKLPLKSGSSILSPSETPPGTEL